MTVVIPANIVTTETQRDKLRAIVDAFYDTVPTNQEFLTRVRGATIIVGRHMMPSIQDIFAVAPDLRYVVLPSVGYQHIDVEFAAAHGIKVCNSPTHNSQAVAEHALSLLLAANRNIVPSQTKLRSGVWDDEAFSGLELAGCTIGLVGYGNIGKRIEAMTAALGMQVRCTNSKSTAADLDELLKASDFICLSVPLNQQTHHLIDARRLELMKPTAVLINVGRGAVVDQVALVAVLKAQKIRAAALDVYEAEPSNGERPNDTIMELVTLPNVTATSHIAYNTPESLEKLGEELLRNIQACLQDKPINVVN